MSPLHCLSPDTAAGLVDELSTVGGGGGAQVMYYILCILLFIHVHVDYNKQQIGTREHCTRVLSSQLLTVATLHVHVLVSA